MKITKYVVSILVVLGVVLAVVLLGKGTSQQAEKPTIAASIFPVKDIAENIVGERMKVVQVLPNGASPHTYEPTVKDKQELSSAQALFIIGVELDNWAKELAEENTKLIDLSGNISLMEGEHEHEEHSEEEEESHEEEEHSDEEEHHEEFDPHYWLSPVNAKLMAQRIYDEVIVIDPENQVYYQQNLNIYLLQLDKLYTELKAEFMNLENKEMITFHSAFGYFASDFDLEVIATIEEFPGKEPTAAYLQEVGAVIREHNVKVLFKEPQLSESIVTTMASDYNIKVLTLDPIGGIGERDSYMQLIKYNAETIIEGLAM